MRRTSDHSLQLPVYWWLNAMTKTQTEISGYRVCLETWQENGEPRSDCWIESPHGACNSLSLLSDLLRFDETDEIISDRVIHRIESWACENGY